MRQVHISLTLMLAVAGAFAQTNTAGAQEGESHQAFSNYYSDSQLGVSGILDTQDAGAESPSMPAQVVSDTLGATYSATTATSATDGDASASSGCENGCLADCCTCKKQKQLAAAVKGAYKGIFADNNFDYLCDPCYDDWHLGESLKRICAGEYVTWDVGGQLRLRQQSEHNIRGLGLTGIDDDFLLTRLRLYANVEYSDWFRFYGEIIDANSDYENFGPRPIEENRADILNLFGDFRLLSGGRGDLWGRVGRQELLYGAQRVISPLDWANTRRTFEGAKLLWKGENWNVDAFWTRPVPDTLANSKTRNKADESREFAGVYATYLNLDTEYFNLYYTHYLEIDGTPFKFDTFGVRWGGARCDWLWEVEAAGQLGEVGGLNSDGAFYSLGVGRKFASFCWDPTFWAYYDWASGKDAGPAGSPATGRGYNHQFPLAHKYMGFMDLYGRRNLEDLNFLFTLQPTEKLKLLAWWHIFHMQANDVPYNVVMGPSATLSGGDSSLGQEIDFTATYAFTPRLNMLLGYSHFFAGDFYSTNPSPGLFDGDADFYYTQLSLDF